MSKLLQAAVAAIDGPQLQRLLISNIRRDGGTQPRQGMDEDAVNDYTAALQRGEDLPAVEVIFDGEQHWLWDGFHRTEAHQRAQRAEINATVRRGTVEDAKWLSCGANRTHGLRRTSADKRRAVEAALRHPKGAALSDRQIAEHCGVDHKTVSAIRSSLHVTGEIPQSNERTGRDGRTINTQSISQSNQQRATRQSGGGIPQVKPMSSTGEFPQSKRVYIEETPKVDSRPTASLDDTIAAVWHAIKNRSSIGTTNSQRLHIAFSLRMSDVENALGEIREPRMQLAPVIFNQAHNTVISEIRGRIANETETAAKTAQQNGAGISDHERLANICSALLGEVPKIRALLGGSGMMTDSLAHTLTIICTALRQRREV